MRFYTTCPPSTAYDAQSYPQRVAQIARWSEAAGAEGTLIYTDNSLVDPWTVAQLMLAETKRLIPMIATQPVYMPPFSVAKRIASLAMLTGRKVALNMVAGGFLRDLQALGDDTAHDDRYARLEEYCRIFQALLRRETVTLDGRFFSINTLRLSPDMPQALLPEIFLSSSSTAGRETSASLGATPVSYPLPPGERPEDPTRRLTRVIRVGLIARNTADEAWALAEQRFPRDPSGSMMHRMATAVSDSEWHHNLSATAERMARSERSTYWLHPFQTYKTFCPYLVGTHAEVAGALADYRVQGVEGLILDVPATRDDLVHSARVIARATGAFSQ